MKETITYKPGYWTFDCFAKSDEALNLVSKLFSSLKLNKGKKNKLSDKQLEARHKAFDRCLSTLIVKTELQAGRQVYHSLGKSSFNASGDGSSVNTFGVSHNNFRLIVDALVAKGYLEHTPGKKYAEEDFNNPDGSPAPLAWSFVASHFAPTLKLIKLIRKYGLTKKTLTSYHFGKDKPKVFLQVSHPSQSNGRNKLRGRKVANNLISSDPVDQAEVADMQFLSAIIFLLDKAQIDVCHNTVTVRSTTAIIRKRKGKWQAQVRLLGNPSASRAFSYQSAISLQSALSVACKTNAKTSLKNLKLTVRAN